MFKGIKQQIRQNQALTQGIAPMAIETIQDAIQFVELVCQTESVAGDRADMGRGILTDAHKYTRTQIRTNYPRLATVDNQFCQSTEPLLEFPALVTAIEQHATRINYPAANRADLQRILGMITAFVNSATRGVENSESMISIPELLLRCWNLAQRVAHRTGDSSVLTQILNCLDGNIIDGGGCMPGVVARLYPAYARLLRHQLTRLPGQHNRAVAVNEDVYLARAIRNSLQQNEQEESALARALNASRIHVQPPAVPTRQDLEFELVMALSALDLDANPDAPPPVTVPIVNQFIRTTQQQPIAAPIIVNQTPVAPPPMEEETSQASRTAARLAKFVKKF